MRIFNLFKKLVKKNKVEEIVIEKLPFSDIENWIEKKIKENELKEKEILFVIEEKIGDFIKEIRGKIVILESFDVEARKEKDITKNVVIASRKKYIESVENLIERLNNLEEPKLEKFMSKTNKIFFDFNKGSFKNYERATILIGKEMASIRNSVRAFSKDLLKIYEEYKDVVDFFKTISQIKLKYQNINLIDNLLDEIIEKKLFLNKKISEEEEENRILKQNLEEIKTSSAYLENLAKQKDIKFIREESKKNILELKQLLDFKALANFFHIFEEPMKIVKTHKEDFHTNFLKANGRAIIGLLDEAKLNNDKIEGKIKEISSKLDEITNNEKDLKEDETQEIYLKIKEVNLEIDNLKIENVKKEKRDEKLKTSKEELIESLKEEFIKLNVEFL